MKCEICKKEIEKYDSVFRTETGHEHLECHRVLGWIVDNTDKAKEIVDACSVTVN